MFLFTAFIQIFEKYESFFHFSVDRIEKICIIL